MNESVPQIDVFCDGGVIGPNPSADGGTWAFVFVQTDSVSVRASGIVTPEQMGVAKITNNLTELLAAVEALEHLPDGWKGVLHTDSNVTRCRLVNDRPAFANIPHDLEARVWRQRNRLGPLRVMLLDGHPTQAHLASGFGKRGQPVSKWNVECDKECNRLAEMFRRESA